MLVKCILKVNLITTATMAMRVDKGHAPHLHLWDSTTLAVDVPLAINKKADLKMEAL